MVKPEVVPPFTVSVTGRLYVRPFESVKPTLQLYWPVAKRLA
jgi:hypothetical protein